MEKDRVVINRKYSVFSARCAADGATRSPRGYAKFVWWTTWAMTWKCCVCAKGVLEGVWAADISGGV